MLSALGENFGDRAKWSKPEGGLYIWLEMNKNVDITEAQKTSINKINVGFHSGVSYSASGMSGKNCIRLCYGYNQPVEIREGIAKLSEYFADLGII
jgi:DNA-binding transcriptional MocR family regulator